MPDDGPIERMLACKRIAVIGLGDDPTKPAYRVSAYMQRHGYTILPVHPTCGSVLGQQCHKSLADVPGPVEVVNVFRRPLACPQVVRDAIAVGAKGVWLQTGIVSDEARQLAADAGLDFVQDECIMVAHAMRHGPR